METVKKFCEETNKPSKSEPKYKITKLKKDILEFCNLVEILGYNLEMARQALNDNKDNYFSLKGKHLAYSCNEGARRNHIANDYISQSIKEIVAVMDKLNNKEGES